MQSPAPVALGNWSGGRLPPSPFISGVGRSNAFFVEKEAHSLPGTAELTTPHGRCVLCKVCACPAAALERETPASCRHPRSPAPFVNSLLKGWLCSNLLTCNVESSGAINELTEAPWPPAEHTMAVTLMVVQLLPQQKALDCFPEENVLSSLLINPQFPTLSQALVRWGRKSVLEDKEPEKKFCIFFSL